MSEFRTITGEDNNLENSQLGSEKTNLMRIFEVFYEDGFNSPKVTDSNGNLLPNPRTISNIVVAQTELIPNYLNATDWLWQWGQFIDHDLTLNEGSPSSPPEDFIPIAVPQDNPHDPLVQDGITQLPFIRSAAAEGTGTALGNPRLQVNELTHFIDASAVYGSTIEVATALRDPNGGGRLLTQTQLLSTGREELLPFQSETEVPAADPIGLLPEQTFVAGDVRVNEQLGLNGIHTLFAREHNRIAGEIEARLNNGDAEIIAQFNNSGLSEDDFIYESARKVVGAKIQIITYNEFLPLLIGSQFHPVDQLFGGGFGIAPFAGYDSNIDPSISSEFANAAYRLGHTLLSPEIQRVEQNGLSGNFIGDAFFDSQQIYNQSNGTGLGVNSVYSGLALQAAQEYDHQIVDGVRNFLFNELRGGLDLASVNIARGREVGLPTLNEARQLLGLTPYTSFNEISSDPGVAERFASAYESIDDIDLWVGGIAEDAVNSGLLGETFNLIVSEQFQRLRDGDRFFYLNELDDLTVLAPDLEHTSLSGVIRENTPESFFIQDNAFILPYEHRLLGTDLDEMLFGCNQADLIEGLGGDDTLQGGNGDDIIFGGSGNDHLRGDNGRDTLVGGEGHDSLNGFSGDDHMLGGDGDDTLRGGRGADLLLGGDGQDTFVIKGDGYSGAYGAHSDLHFDIQGKVIFERILDFNPYEDMLVLEDMRINGIDSVHYDSLTGEIILTDTVNGEVTSSHVIAQLQPGLNLEIHNQGHGNWTIS
ncbi:MAG: peroxidase family protein [Xenococcus sp. (in: cyanobacteria)]